ncbi:alpha-L-fucosidase, partial [Kitasatospora sp. NPDC058965]|uniref:alpha-L-fucosidase n=1 Tax=Kitasatospora sp. NPDC058965 TaxID=3346682 RepID=UPI0036D202CB
MHNTATTADIGIGNDVHPSALTRGLHGTVGEADYTTFTGPFRTALLQHVTPCVTDPSTVQPAGTIALLPNECADSVIAKAAQVRPDPRQVAWQRGGPMAFLHFGVNTFTGLEWGTGTEDPNVFQPTGLDTDQWAQTLKADGFAGAILTVKHHDGFLLYPSRYSNHSVASSSWDGGKGDVLRSFADSMHKYGLRVGVYISPADENQYANGVYANGSARTARTVPTLVPGDDRAGKGLPSYTLPADDYGAYMLNQLYEVLTQYGTVDEVWFDGAQGRIPADKVESYDFDSWYELIRALAPQAVIANEGPDVRWVGNESGVGRQNEWSVLPSTAQADGKPSPTADYSAADMGSRAVLATAGADATQLSWYPSETDVSIRPGWFYHSAQDGQLKTVGQLTDIYRQSQGRDSLLLLNVPPNQAGQLAPGDVARLNDWHADLTRLFSDDLARAATATATDTAPGSSPANALDGSPDTAWQTGGGVPATLTVDLGAAERVDTVAAAEDIRQGQQIDSFTVEYQDATGAWVPIPTAEQTLSVGAGRILPLTTPVTAQRIRQTVT